MRGKGRKRGRNLSPLFFEKTREIFLLDFLENTFYLSFLMDAPLFVQNC
jgi:hypothetical protein